MESLLRHYDALERWNQVSAQAGAQLVRIMSLAGGNRYIARPIELDDSGQTELAGQEELTVTNLAEPADAAGLVAAGTDALAIDVGGWWVVFIGQAGSSMFCAKVISAAGSGQYLVREQQLTAQGQVTDAPGAIDMPATNLAELSLGPGAAVDVGTVILATGIKDTASPPTLRYVFHHPAYAKYLD
jgi:hypothetical protein